jgi:hypothetical protein
MGAPISNSSERANPSLDRPFGTVDFGKTKPQINGVSFTLVLGGAVVGAVLFVAGLVTLAAAGALFAPPVAAAIGLAGVGLIAAKASVIYIGLNVVSVGLTFMAIAAIANLFNIKVAPALKKTDAAL